MLFVLLVFAGDSIFNSHTQRGHQKERDKVHDKYITGTQMPSWSVMVPKDRRTRAARKIQSLCLRLTWHSIQGSEGGFKTVGLIYREYGETTVAYIVRKWFYSEVTSSKRDRPPCTQAAACDCFFGKVQPRISYWGHVMSSKWNWIKANIQTT